MDRIVCTVDNKAGAVPADYADKICAVAAEAVEAQPISAGEMATLVQSRTDDGGSARIHVVEAAIPSAREIAFRYSVGSTNDWRDQREKQFDDLHIDIVDANLNEATVGMFADTLRRLSR